MADSVTNLNTISSSQAAKETTANELFDAHSPASLFGRNADATSALTWGYYGGKYRKADGTIATIVNGTVSLTASATNYIKETDGVVSVTTAAPSGWPSPLSGGAKALYAVVCGSSSVTSYTDYRTTGLGSGNSAGATTASEVSITDSGNYFTSTDVEGALQEVGAALGGVTGGVKLKGVIDCSANPNYPAASAGDFYKVSVAGKIGGAAGVDVEIGDSILCTTTASSGNQATVGASWYVIQANTTVTTEGALIHSAAGKTTPVDADEIPLVDSAASNVLKKLPWANLKATLKTYFDTLYAALSTVNVFTKNQCVSPVALTDAATITVDASLSNNFSVTLGGNRSLANPTNLTAGMVLNFCIDQDATGNRTLTYGNLYKFPGGTVTLSTAASAKDFLSCYYDGTVLRCNLTKAYS